MLLLTIILAALSALLIVLNFHHASRYQKIAEESDEIKTLYDDLVKRVVLSAKRKEIYAEYVLTDSDFILSERKMLNRVKERLARRVGDQAVAILGEPEYDKENKTYSYKLFVSK